MIKTYQADRPCKACGYWPNLRRAKFEGSIVTYDTDNPGFISIKHVQCGHVWYLGENPSRASRDDAGGGLSDGDPARS